jgi:hypothetical protein
LSTESELNAPPSTVEKAPAAEYAPMPDPVAERDDKRKTYEGDTASAVREAAQDLSEARERTVPQADPASPVDRGYKYYNGERAGEEVESHLTLDEARAARDLKMVREWESANAQPQPAEVAAAVDDVRAHVAEASQTAEQPAQTAETQQPQAVDGVHPDVIKALENEHVRNALAQEVAQVSAARDQYAEATRAALQLSAVNLYSSFPELAKVPTDQIQTAISVIAATNPERAQQITAHLERTQNLYAAHQQAEAARQQAAAHQQQQRAQQFGRPAGRDLREGGRCQGGPREHAKDC